MTERRDSEDCKEHTDPSDPFKHRAIYQKDVSRNPRRDESAVVQRIAITNTPIDWFSRVLSIITLVVLIGTLFYVTKQWETMDETLEATRDASKAQSRAAIRALDAAISAARSADDFSERTLRLTRESNEHAQRAWFLLRNVDRLDGVRGKFRVTLRFVNYGQSPASHISVFWDLIVSAPGPFPDIEKYLPAEMRDPKVFLHKGSGLAGPQSEYISWQDRELTPVQAAAVEKGTQYLFIVGRAVYQDEFSTINDDVRVTDFCEWYTAPIDVELGKKPGPIHFKHCGAGNRAK